MQIYCIIFLIFNVDFNFLHESLWITIMGLLDILDLYIYLVSYV